MQRERGFQRGPHRGGRGNRGRGRGEDKQGLLKAQGGVKKTKPASVKNQIRSIERLLRTALAPDVKATQEARLAELRKVVDAHAQSELERKLAVRYHKIKFFERRKVERRIRRTECALRALADAGTDSQEQQAELNQQLSQLKEDLEYVRFFPKDQKYVALFAGGDDEEIQNKRKEMRVRVKANIAAAKAANVEAASGSEGEEGSGDISDDDFFMKGDVSNADADDEWTDISPREDVDQKPGDGAREKDALPIHRPLDEDVEEAEETPLPVRHVRDPTFQRGGRGRSASLAIQPPRRGVGSSKPHHGLGRGGRQTNGSDGGGNAFVKRKKPSEEMFGRQDKSQKRAALGEAVLQDVDGLEDKKKRKRTRPKKKK